MNQSFSMENEKLAVKETYAQMARLCSRSEQCSPDIKRKILAVGHQEEEADEIIGMLKKEKFLNDERYVKAYVADKFRMNKWGKIKMRYYLRGKGLPDEIIQTGLDQIDDEKYKQALLKVLKDKAKSVKKKNKFEKMGQVIRFAQSRGFEPEMI
ncbi:MAG TPA: regulatory protein RecX, partial [Draconibacterium sp.]|nr:regulatory protein RecX [Draconibacterium sp.]